MANPVIIIDITPCYSAFKAKVRAALDSKKFLDIYSSMPILDPEELALWLEASCRETFIYCFKMGQTPIDAPQVVANIVFEIYTSKALEDMANATPNESKKAN